MLKVLVSVYPWENPELFITYERLKKGDKVVVSVDENEEMGIVLKESVDTDEKIEKKIVRIAEKRDLEIYNKYEKEKNPISVFCREEIKKRGLPMKIIDLRISLDGKQMIFVFTADGRVDFRDLVKNLSGRLKKSVRMQQIGSRDEARKLGGFGICGRELCCVNFKGDIPSITTDMARVQKIAHRGTDRISGLCGRLMCCLAYETSQYKNLLEGMPELYSILDTKEGRGTVVEIDPIKQEVRVKVEDGKYVILKKEEINK